MQQGSTTERCQRCHTRIIRNLDQPPLCGHCAPPSAASAIYRVVSARVALRNAQVIGESRAAQLAAGLVRHA